MKINKMSEKDKQKDADEVAEKIVLAIDCDRSSNAMSSLACLNTRVLVEDVENCKCEERIAAAQIVHVLEGWLNFSSALQSFVNNEISQAQHLAYYGELRAVLSLIAWGGTDLKGKTYRYFASTGALEKLKFIPTHQLAWSFWQKWIATDVARDLIFENIKLTEDRSLNDVSELLSSFLPVDERSIRNWGFDLMTNAINDRDQRNHSSYGIQLASKEVSYSENDIKKFVTNVWDLLFPVTTSIWQFDMAMVKYVIKSVEKTLCVTDSKEPLSDELESIHYRVLKSLSISDERLIKYLESNADLEIFEFATKDEYDVKNMLSRSLIFLRIATLALKRSIIRQENVLGWIDSWLRRTIAINFPEDLELNYLIDGYQEAYNQFLDNSSNLNQYTMLMRPTACLAWGLTQ
jgi:hypothetical protein